MHNFLKFVRTSSRYVLEEEVILCWSTVAVCQWRNAGEPDTGQGERIPHHSQTPALLGHCPRDALSPRQRNATQVGRCADHVHVYVL